MDKLVLEKVEEREQPAPRLVLPLPGNGHHRQKSADSRPNTALVNTKKRSLLLRDIATTTATVLKFFETEILEAFNK